METPPGTNPAAPPLSRNLRDFTASEKFAAAYSVGEPRRTSGVAAFQSIIPLRSFCLSVSGAVAPSAPAGSRSLPQDSADCAAILEHVWPEWKRPNALRYWLLRRPRRPRGLLSVAESGWVE